VAFSQLLLRLSNTAGRWRGASVFFYEVPRRLATDDAAYSSSVLLVSTAAELTRPCVGFFSDFPWRLAAGGLRDQAEDLPGKLLRRLVFWAADPSFFLFQPWPTEGGMSTGLPQRS